MATIEQVQSQASQYQSQLAAQQQIIASRRAEQQTQQAMRQIQTIQQKAQQQQYVQRLGTAQSQIKSEQERVTAVQGELTQAAIQQQAQRAADIKAIGYQAGVEAASSGQGWRTPGEGSIASEPGFREAFDIGYQAGSASPNRGFGSTSGAYAKGYEPIEMTGTITTIPAQKLAPRVVTDYVSAPTKSNLQLIKEGVTQTAGAITTGIGKGIESLGVSSAKVFVSAAKTAAKLTGEKKTEAVASGVEQKIGETTISDIAKVGKTAGIIAATLYPITSPFVAAYYTGQTAIATGKSGAEAYQAFKSGDIKTVAGKTTEAAFFGGLTYIGASATAKGGKYLTSEKAIPYTNPLTGKQAKTQTYVDIKREDVLAPLGDKMYGRSTITQTIKQEQLRTTPAGEFIGKITGRDPSLRFVEVRNEKIFNIPLEGTLGTQVSRQIYSDVLGKDISQTVKPSISFVKKEGSKVGKVYITGGEQVPYSPSEYANLPAYKKALIPPVMPDTAITNFGYSKSLYLGKYNAATGKFQLSEPGKRISAGEFFSAGVKIKEGQYSDLYGNVISERQIASVSPRPSATTVRYPFLSKVYKPGSAEQVLSMNQPKEITFTTEPIQSSMAGKIAQAAKTIQAEAKPLQTIQVTEIVKPEIIKPAAITTPITLAPPIQIPRTAVKAAAASVSTAVKLTPAASVLSLQRQTAETKQIQPVVQREKQETIQTTETIQTPKLTSTQIITPTQTTSSVTTQLQISPLLQITTNIPESVGFSAPSPTPQITTPETPFIKLPEEKKIKKKAAALSEFSKAFSVFIRRRGKEIEIARGLPYGKALKKGSERVIETLAASFKIRPTGTTTLPDISYLPSSKVFRPGKRDITRFVQRKGGKEGGLGRLASYGERAEIKMFKKAKSRSIRIL